MSDCLCKKEVSIRHVGVGTLKAGMSVQYNTPQKLEGVGGLKQLNKIHAIKHNFMCSGGLRGGKSNSINQLA